MTTQPLLLLPAARIAQARNCCSSKACTQGSGIDPRSKKAPKVGHPSNDLGGFFMSKDQAPLALNQAPFAHLIRCASSTALPTYEPGVMASSSFFASSGIASP